MIARLSSDRLAVTGVGRGERGDLSHAEWERLRPSLPVRNGQCERWRGHLQVIDGILYRVWTGVQRLDLPERFGPWKKVYERHRLGSGKVPGNVSAAHVGRGRRDG
ncbi:transposase [Streptomyces sp. NPDC017958]|uniref:transposase n=1 Tax=Streptomyces sp. NPDC017958 TaxID=3365021 RepID=UPI00379F5EB0